MAEGERSEPRPHDSWSALEKRQRSEQARENAELLQQARKRDIDSHIAELRRQAQIPLNNLDASMTGLERDKQERQNIKYKLRREHQANVYEFMKKKYHA